jgi:hypothetical protein
MLLRSSRMSDMDFSDLTETDPVKLFLEIAKNGQITERRLI